MSLGHLKLLTDCLCYELNSIILNLLSKESIAGTAVSSLSNSILLMAGGCFYAIGYFLQQYDIYKKCIAFIVLTIVL